VTAPPPIALPPRTARVRLHRSALRVLFAGAKVWWFLRRPHTRGVKLVLRSGEHLLLVRHAYGRSDWELPGGGAHRDEAPVATARREAREELGVDLPDWRVVGAFEDHDRATAHLTCLTTEHDGSPLRLDGAELLDARWWPADDLPRPLGHLATRALALDPAHDHHPAAAGR